MKQRGMMLCGLFLLLMAFFIAGCNQGDDAAEMAQRLQAMSAGNAGGNGQAQTSAAPVAQQDPVGLNPCVEDVVEGEQVYSGPKVDVTDFFVKLPYEGYEGSKRFDINVSVQAMELISTKAIWKIIALDAEGNVLGSQELHLSIPNEYKKPLDINSFFCTAVPASLEFQLTGKEAKRAGESGGGDSGGGGGNSSGRGIS